MIDLQPFEKAWDEYHASFKISWAHVCEIVPNVWWWLLGITVIITAILVAAYCMFDWVPKCTTRGTKILSGALCVVLAVAAPILFFVLLGNAPTVAKPKAFLPYIEQATSVTDLTCEHMTYDDYSHNEVPTNQQLSCSFEEHNTPELGTLIINHDKNTATLFRADSTIVQPTNKDTTS